MTTSAPAQRAGGSHRTERPPRGPRRRGRKRWLLPIGTLLLISVPVLAILRDRDADKDAAAAPAVTAPAAPRWTNAGAPPVGTARYAVPAAARWVSPRGNDRAAGTARAPWRTLGHAAAAAPTGSTIVLAAGTYHESVSLTRRVTVQPAPGAAVWLDGSSPITGWVPDGNAWRVPYHTHFDSDDPTGLLVTPSTPLVGHPDQVFVDAAAMRAVGSLSQVGPGTFYVDHGTHTLWLGSNPARHQVAASDLTTALTVRGAGSVVRGIGVRRYGTPIAKLGAVRGWADKQVFSDDVFTQNAMAGLSLTGAAITVSHASFVDNGQIGLQANRADLLTVRDSLASGNNTRGFPTGQAAGGIKITSSRVVRVTTTIARGNHGAGAWFDNSSYDVVVTWSRFVDNDRDGLLYEISANGTIVGNDVSGNKRYGVYVLDSNNVEVGYDTFDRAVHAVVLRDGSRDARDLSIPGHDKRRPQPDPEVTWQLTGIQVHDNLMASAARGQGALLALDAPIDLGPNVVQVTADRDVYVPYPGDKPGYIVKWDAVRQHALVAQPAALAAQLGQERHGQRVDTSQLGVTQMLAGCLLQATGPQQATAPVCALVQRPGARISALLGLPATTRLAPGTPTGHLPNG